MLEQLVRAVLEWVAVLLIQWLRSLGAEDWLEEPGTVTKL